MPTRPDAAFVIFSCWIESGREHAGDERDRPREYEGREREAQDLERRPGAAGTAWRSRARDRGRRGTARAACPRRRAGASWTVRAAASGPSPPWPSAPRPRSSASPGSTMRAAVAANCVAMSWPASSRTTSMLSRNWPERLDVLGHDERVLGAVGDRHRDVRDRAAGRCRPARPRRSSRGCAAWADSATAGPGRARCAPPKLFDSLMPRSLSGPKLSTNAARAWSSRPAPAATSRSLIGTENSTSRRTRSGCLRANAAAMMPPREWPDDRERLVGVAQQRVEREFDRRDVVVDRVGDVGGLRRLPEAEQVERDSAVRARPRRTRPGSRRSRRSPHRAGTGGDGPRPGRRPPRAAGPRSS